MAGTDNDASLSVSLVMGVINRRQAGSGAKGDQLAREHQYVPIGIQKTTLI